MNRWLTAAVRPMALVLLLAAVPLAACSSGDATGEPTTSRHVTTSTRPVTTATTDSTTRAQAAVTTAY
jgi:hypothetical protein